VPYSAAPELRFVPGPQDGLFSAAGIETFCSAEYRIGAEADRMGYRLEGPEISFAEGCTCNIISDGISFGSIQVPSGKPIILMADRQTVGGYAKIGCVASVDLPLLAQLKAGDTVRFKPISVEEAQELYVRRRQLLRDLDRRLNKARTAGGQEYRIVVNGEAFLVFVEALD